MLRLKVQVRVMLYRAVVQTVLLYGREIWVVTGSIINFLEGLHNQVARRIVDKTSWRMVDGEWVFSPVSDAREIAGLCTIKD